jgi:hypothetical protein
MTKYDYRLSNKLDTDLQKLRCRVNYHALRFTNPIQKLGEKLIQRMREKSRYFIALHLRYTYLKLPPICIFHFIHTLPISVHPSSFWLQFASTCNEPLRDILFLRTTIFGPCKKYTAFTELSQNMTHRPM